MLKILCSLEFKKLLGLNIFLHSKNQKNLHLHAGMNLSAYIIVTLICTTQITAQLYGLTISGAGSLIPLILISLGSYLVLLFSLIGAGHKLFSQKGLSILHSMPISMKTVALSRLITQYVTNLILLMILFTPGMILYGIVSQQNFSYYLIMTLGIMGTPLLPLTLSLIVNTVMIIFSSKTNHPDKTQIVLSVLVTLIFFISPLIIKPLQFSSSDPDLVIAQVINTLPDRISYPPAKWINIAVSNNDFQGLAVFLAVSLAAAVCVTVIFCNYFDRICQTSSRQHSLSLPAPGSTVKFCAA